MLDVCLDSRVLKLTLNRPERRNALNLELCQALLAALDKAETDSAVGAVLLNGCGPAFCAGMDLNEALSVDANTLTEAHERLFSLIDRIRKPVVAAVHGAALAGGTGLVANAHIVIASPDSMFGLTEVRIGLWPILVSRAVTLAIGERRATEWSLSGRIVGAEEACQAGLVTAVWAHPIHHAEEQAKTMAAYSPNVIAEGLQYVSESRQRCWDDNGKAGRDLRLKLVANPDFAEGVDAFKNKRAPVWPSMPR